MDVMFFPRLFKVLCFYGSLSHGDTHDIHYTTVVAIIEPQNPVFCGSPDRYSWQAPS